MSRRFEQSDHPPNPEPGPEVTQSAAGHAAPGDERPSELSRRLGQLEQERDFLLRHGQNLEVELRRLGRLRGRVRELESLLGEAEERLRRVESMYLAWRLLEPFRAVRRFLRRLRG